MSFLYNIVVKSNLDKKDIMTLQFPNGQATADTDPSAGNIVMSF